jgi:hypothetical protein
METMDMFCLSLSQSGPFPDFNCIYLGILYNMILCHLTVTQQVLLM